MRPRARSTCPSASVALASRAGVPRLLEVLDGALVARGGLIQRAVAPLRLGEGGARFPGMFGVVQRAQHRLGLDQRLGGALDLPLGQRVLSRTQPRQRFLACGIV